MPQKLTRKTISAVAFPLLNLNDDWSRIIPRSKNGDNNKDKLNRAGRIILFATHKPEYINKNCFHWPAASGLKWNFFPCATQAIITHVIYEKLDTKPYDSKQFTPNFAKESFDKIKSPFHPLPLSKLVKPCEKDTFDEILRIWDCFEGIGVLSGFDLNSGGSEIVILIAFLMDDL